MNGKTINAILKEAFEAGRNYEKGKYESNKSYNKFTGTQDINKHLNFDDWLVKLRFNAL